METNLAYHVDKVLGIVPNEIFGHLELIVVRKYFCDQRDALGHGECATDQLCPGRIFTAYNKLVGSAGIRSPE
jgi:hypothetical protein